MIIILLGDPAMYYSKIPRSLLQVFFIIPFTQTNAPTPLAKMQPKNISEPPPCFTEGMVFFALKALFFLPPKTLRTEMTEKLYFRLV